MYIMNLPTLSLSILLSSKQSLKLSQTDLNMDQLYSYIGSIKFNGEGLYHHYYDYYECTSTTTAAVITVAIVDTDTSLDPILSGCYFTKL